MSVPGKYGNEHPGKYESRKILSLLRGTRFIMLNLIGWQQIQAFWIEDASLFGPDCFLVHTVQPYLRSLFGVRAKLNVCREIEERMMVGLVGKPNLHCVGLTCFIRFWKQNQRDNHNSCEGWTAHLTGPHGGQKRFGRPGKAAHEGVDRTHGDSLTLDCSPPKERTPVPTSRPKAWVEFWS